MSILGDLCKSQMKKDLDKLGIKDCPMIFRVPTPPRKEVNTIITLAKQVESWLDNGESELAAKIMEAIAEKAKEFAAKYREPQLPQSPPKDRLGNSY